MADAPLMTVDRLDELIRAVFEELLRRDLNASGREVLASVVLRLKLTPAELSRNESGIPRWETNIRFHTTDCVKAGYLQKANGFWKLTELGREALKQPAGQLIRLAKRAYRDWKVKQKGEERQSAVIPISADEDQPRVRRDAFDRAEEEARAGIENHINQLSPYELQDLIRHLLTAMGYYVAHTALPGPDAALTFSSTRTRSERRRPGSRFRPSTDPARRQR